ncbi:MAG: NAD(P)/FAD-dependent oxidoreductase [Verrucomicrobiota bacterium]|nr:NAD(P)/FAD-dependent oxidoreductase [Verrucomicrobiota bacterium]
MSTFDVAIIGGGPGGSTCAAFCAQQGLRTLLLEREKFPREKVCGDTLNPACWPVFQRLGTEAKLRASPHGPLARVEFISLRGLRIPVDLPRNGDAEISLKRSILDLVLLERARALGAEVHEATTLTALQRADDDWQLTTADAIHFRARVVVAADGRNSTVARLLKLLPRATKERVALQAHVPLPRDFGDRVVLQLLPGGYSGQAPVNKHELNLCLVGKPKSLRALQDWATKTFVLPASQTWRTITPLARTPLPPARENLLLVGDAARVVEPFTGEGIFYALRSGEIASSVIGRMARGDRSAAHDYAAQHAALYRGRLWVNSLARASVVSPTFGSLVLEIARFQPALMRFLTAKIVR